MHLHQNNENKYGILRRGELEFPKGGLTVCICEPRCNVEPFAKIVIFRQNHDLPAPPP